MAQKTIHSFFKPLQASNNKRSASNDSLTLDNKKVCVDSSLRSNFFENQLQEEIDEQSKKTSVIPTTFGHSWFKALKTEMKKPYFIKLNYFIEEERKKGSIYPIDRDVFSWTELCSVNSVKVVILGQDPYHGPKQAHGLCFSVKKGVSVPPSLVNIFSEVKNNYSSFIIPKHGDLTGWAKQGVLLLNACLTVRAGNANSHANKGWEEFTDAVIKHLNDNRKNIVFLLWGSYAQKKGAFIDAKKHLVLKTVHPSPLSAYRGFLGCGHFKTANDYLNKNGIERVDWTFTE